MFIFNNLLYVLCVLYIYIYLSIIQPAGMGAMNNPSRMNDTIHVPWYSVIGTGLSAANSFGKLGDDHANATTAAKLNMVAAYEHV